MKLSEGSSTKSTATQLSKAWQCVRRKLSTSKSREKLKGFKDFISHSKPEYSGPSPIYECYRSKRPATPHAVALLNTSAPAGTAEPEAQPLVEATSEMDHVYDHDPTFEVEADPDLETDIEPQTDSARTAKRILAPLSFISREFLAFLDSDRPVMAARMAQDHSHAGRSSSSSLLLGPRRRLRMSSSTRNSRATGTAEPTSCEEEIARLSHELLMRDVMISDLYFQVNVSQRRKACIRFSRWPWPCQRSLRKTIAELEEENQAKEREIAEWKVKYYQVVRADGSSREDDGAVIALREDVRRSHQLLRYVYHGMRRREGGAQRSRDVRNRRSRGNGVV